MRWSAGLVEVGSGGVPGQSRFLVLDDMAAPLDINALTVGAGFQAEWYFPRAIGNFILYFGKRKREQFMIWVFLSFIVSLIS